MRAAVLALALVSGVAQIHRNGRQVYLGTFATAELAHQAYKQAAHGIKGDA